MDEQNNTGMNPETQENKQPETTQVTMETGSEQQAFYNAENAINEAEQAVRLTVDPITTQAPEQQQAPQAAASAPYEQQPVYNHIPPQHQGYSQTQAPPQGTYYSQPQQGGYAQQQYNNYQQPQYQQPQQQYYQQPSYQPPHYQAQPPVAGRSKGIASLILGIASCVLSWTVIFGFPLGIAGLVLSVLARKEMNEAPTTGMYSPSGMITAGMILSIIGLAIGFLMGSCICFAGLWY